MCENSLSFERFFMSTQMFWKWCLRENPHILGRGYDPSPTPLIMSLVIYFTFRCSCHCSIAITHVIGNFNALAIRNDFARAVHGIPHTTTDTNGDVNTHATARVVIKLIDFVMSLPVSLLMLLFVLLLIPLFNSLFMLLLISFFMQLFIALFTPWHCSNHQLCLPLVTLPRGTTSANGCANTHATALAIIYLAAPTITFVICSCYITICIFVWVLFHKSEASWWNTMSIKNTRNTWCFVSQIWNLLMKHHVIQKHTEHLVFVSQIWILLVKHRVIQKTHTILGFLFHKFKA